MGDGFHIVVLAIRRALNFLGWNLLFLYKNSRKYRREVIEKVGVCRFMFPSIRDVICDTKTRTTRPLDCRMGWKCTKGSKKVGWF